MVNYQLVKAFIGPTSVLAGTVSFFRTGTWVPSLALVTIAVIALASTTGLAKAAEPLSLPPDLVSLEQTRIAAIEKAKPSAVCVFVPGGGGGGSGVLISPEGYALTNFHVTSPAGSYMRCGLSDGRVYDAVLVGLDPVGDLAMIKLLGRDDFPVAEMADSLKAQAGDWCMVIGNPFLLATNLQPTVTWGMLSGVGRYQYPSGTLLEYADCLQTDASINPGNSGGPIYNSEGQLLGIVGRCSFEKRGRVNVGVGYAISINQAKNFLGYLRSGRIVDHATLGATVSTDPDGGVVVSNILESSDAFRRGMRFNSEILEIDGRVVTTANDVQNVLGTLPNGWRVEIAFREAGKTFRVPVRLMGVHRRDELLAKMQSALPPPPPVPDEPKKSEPSEGDESEGDESNPNEDAAPSEDTPSKEKRTAHAGSGIPDAASKLIIDRKGFANYYFNQQQQDRFINRLRQQFPANASEDEPNQGYRWTIEGKNADGDAILLEVSDASLAMTVGGTRLTAENPSDLFEAVDRDAVGGILAALDGWRKMIEVGPTKFGEAYFHGTMPLGGKRPLRDCTVGIYGEMEIRWLMHPDSGMVECVEVFADRDSDPAELWINHKGDQIESLELKYGLDTKLTVQVNRWEREEVSAQ
ncbi:trypsin-like peptidase domain-containing protein [Stieleria sp. JC731]|uniref:S1C family serine protease n=1 Tax=Pirellulaceae TaxID=2691357 RepID=UPI001E4F416A|nr:trypsin-like peptidase domain-containing protein [Stieleria sp. JC731]MCC9602422.1 trypsin-like peptidase domain-containing protein [Stieleria sp. JC731]